MTMFVVITFTLFMFIAGCVALWAIAYQWLESRDARGQQIKEDLDYIASLLPNLESDPTAARQIQERVSHAYRLLRGLW